MNIYKRDPDGPYWFRFRYRGQEIRRSTEVRNKETAKDIASAFRTKLVKGELDLNPAPKKQIPRFDKAMADFLEWSEQEYQAHPATHKRYLTSSKALLRHFGTKPLDSIQKDDVEQFKAARAKEKKRPAGRATRRTSKATIRPATCNRELALLGHLFNHFSDLLEGRNPCRRVKKLEEDNYQDRVLTADEERLYLLACSQPVRDIAIMMLQSGMRPEEVCRIRRENVFLEAGYVFNPFGKTKAARRRVPLSQTAVSVLSRRLDSINGPWLFPGRVKDRPLVKVNAAHTSAVRRSGIAPFRLYDCRHTFASRAVQAGVDLVTLATLLGHSKINMVLRYAHPSQEHQFAAIERMQAAISATA